METLPYPFHLHEALISRGDVRGASAETHLLIHDRWNCIHIHPSCHPFAEGGEGQLITIASLIMFEGYEPIRKWALSIEIVGIREILAKLDLAFDLLKDGLYADRSAQ